MRPGILSHRLVLSTVAALALWPAPVAAQGAPQPQPKPTPQEEPVEVRRRGASRADRVRARRDRQRAAIRGQDSTVTGWDGAQGR